MLLLDLYAGNRLTSVAALKAAGVGGVYLKASEGATYTDPMFARRRKLLREAGIPIGAYHYAYPTGGDAEAEARHFIKTVQTLPPGSLRPALDLEITHGPTGAALVAWARAFNHVLFDRWGVWPLFYSYPWFIQQLRATVPIGGGLWLASYGPNDGQRHGYTVPKPWRKTLLHQYTSRGRVGGAVPPTDLNYCESLQPLLL